ncbi:ImmA/IrrE family metallo-endopeptidase [Zongyangia hominis]|uniref:ImmA/IrrE family metallo-endopeptidase n=1 Tax=Zongyangia hominis TaxID=2763677 RepID=A0A926EDU9_9FIRM|nr:ImmA/IrrE family metallo-endopeptidase [Zongyangia hominis]MBC8570604.1 ImmA/IrrE family metallo-endopeptidase [Zongyangia hominis]
MDYIRTLAADLIAAFSTRDPFELCDALDILVLKADLPIGMNGFFTTLLGHRVIYLALGLPRERQRQICAHELGHALLHQQMNRLFMEKSTHLAQGRYEREADLFAACLLIDDNMLKEGEGRTIEELSCLAGVDRRLMELRFPATPGAAPAGAG